MNEKFGVPVAGLTTQIMSRVMRDAAEGMRSLEWVAVCPESAQADLERILADEQLWSIQQVTVVSLPDRDDGEILFIAKDQYAVWSER